MNLIDSPGHIEFSFEVSSGLRVCDAAFVLVDTVEGVLSQTYTVLKKSCEEGIQCILVLNKMDKLITDLDFSPQEAYHHISQILDSTNAALDSFLRSKIAEETGSDDIDENLLEEMENRMLFNPCKGNVIFASSLHGWGFTVSSFVDIFATKLGAKPEVLNKTLYGNYYFDTKNKKIVTKPLNDNHRPMFVQFILQNIFTVYETIQAGDQEKLLKMAKGQNVNVNSKNIDNIKSDPTSVIKSFMGEWLPLAKEAFKVSVEHMPDPQKSQEERVFRICKKLRSVLKQNDPILEKITNGIKTNDPEGPLVAFISKMIHIPYGNVNEKNLTNNHRDIHRSELLLFGFARIFSGTLKRGDKIYVILPKKRNMRKESQELDGANNPHEIKYESVEVEINHLYIWMGQYLEGIEKAVAGCIIAIGDVGHIGFKTATLSSLPECPVLTKMNFDQNLLKVTLSTKKMGEMDKQIEGQQKQNKADPAIETYTNENGAIVLETSGEIHLERCLRDLEEYAKVEINVSDPIISFKETILNSKFRLRKYKKKKSFEDFEKTAKEDDEKLVTEQNNIKEELEKEKMKNHEVEQVKVEDTDNKEEIVDEWWYNDWSTFVEPSDSEDETEQQDPLAKDTNNILPDDLGEWDDGTKAIDHTDDNFAFMESKLKYQEIQQESKQISKKGKGLKMEKNNLQNVKGKMTSVEVNTPNQKYTLTVRAVSMKYEFALWIQNNQSLIKKLFYSSNKKDSKDYKQFFDMMINKMRETGFDKRLIQLVLRYMISFGPRKTGANLLLVLFSDIQNNLLRKHLDESQCVKYDKMASGIEKHNLSDINFGNTEIINDHYNGLTEVEIIKAIENGFEIALENGPLVGEPMFGNFLIFAKSLFCRWGMSPT